MEVYVDDMLVKSTLRTDHLQHLGEAFNLLRKYKIKLNPEKCTFGVASGKFLGYLVTQRGIEADPNQISSILNMRSPTCMKEVQMLNGRLAVLNRFISRSVDKCKPFFQEFKKNWGDFCWNEEYESAFQSLEKYLASPPLLSKLTSGEMFLYIAVSELAVSGVLTGKKKACRSWYTTSAIL